MLSVVIEDEVLQHHADAAATRGTMTATLRCCNETLQHHLVAASTRSSTINASLLPRDVAATSHCCVGAASLRCCNKIVLQLPAAATDLGHGLTSSLPWLW